MQGALSRGSEAQRKLLGRMVLEQGYRPPLSLGEIRDDNGGLHLSLHRAVFGDGNGESECWLDAFCIGDGGWVALYGMALCFYLSLSVDVYGSRIPFAFHFAQEFNAFRVIAGRPSVKRCPPNMICGSPAVPSDPRIGCVPRRCRHQSQCCYWEHTG
jgi:hypothetical protein